MVAQTGHEVLITHRVGLFGLAMRLFLSVCFAFFLSSSLLAQTAAKIVATQEDGFGRIVFSFENLPEYKIRVTTGVLVVAFDEQVEVDPSKVTINLSRYIGAARVDPDRRAVRFALAQSLSVNTMEAGDQLFVDLLPAGWQGMAPGLPEEVVAELARRAEKAEAKARREALEAAARENAAIVGVQAGQYQTFSRISFNWNQPFEASLARDGDKILITFNKLATIDLDNLRASKPRFLTKISSSLTDRGLVLELAIQSGAAVRAFTDGRSYVVDLSADGGGFSGRDNSGDPGNGASEIRLNGRDTGESRQPAWRRQSQSTITANFVPLDASQRVPDDYGDWVNARVELPISDPTSPSNAREQNSTNNVRASEPPEVTEQDVGVSAENASLVPVTFKRNARSVTIVFNFPNPVRAAVFQRGKMIWSVFDSDIPIDLGSIQKDLADRVESVRITRSGEMQYVRIKLKGVALTSVAGRNRLWTITIGDMVAEATKPLTLRRSLGDDGLPRVVVEMADAGPVHWLEDTEIGDRLAVVTAFGPARGMIKQQNFVEFTLYPSAHGLALSAGADDLRVLSQVDQVVIGRRQGLWLSAADGLVEGSTRDVSGAMRPAYIDYNLYREGGDGGYLPNRRKYERAVLEAEDEDRNEARLDLVRFYISHFLASEASAVLNLLDQESPSMAKLPTFNALAGIVQTLLSRPVEAKRYFSSPGLAQGREIKLWRGLAEAMQGNWPVAKEYIGKGEDLLWEYPDELRARFFATAARSALELNDFETANHHLAVLEDIDGGKKVAAETHLLRGRYLVGIGRSAAGLALYDAAIDSAIRPIEAEARYLKLVLLQESGTIDQEDLTAQMENLSMSWRGGTFELETLRRLSDLYTEQNRFRDLFEVMKTVSKISNDSEITREIQDKIAVAFRELFLGDQADMLSPVEALSLFYDHRVLTPVGRQGDEMVRRLAERLIDVDLLDQAAELLTHQVDNRLSGAARAQVAAQLALVHVMNRNPVEAIKVLNRTQFIGIPHKIKRQRNILMARALSDAGRMELALDILDTMIGENVEALKADILWQARAWQGAAEQYELVLGDSWKSDEPMTKEQRNNALRSAISYSLANDQLGLDRLRSKFFQKISQTPDAGAFQVVTDRVADQGLEFRELARELAAVDTLETFLREFREQQSELFGRGSSEPQG